MSGQSRLHIAMIGQRGVPATYGGVERHVEELGARLAARGHRVTVFNRRGYAEPADRSWRGMDVRTAASVPTKHLEAFTHSAASVVAAARLRPDVIHFHAIGPGLVSPVARRISRAAIVQTIHGLDADRSKWGGTASRTLRYAEGLSARVPDETIVVSRALGRHYADVHGRQVSVIANGVEPSSPMPIDVLPAEWELTERSFLLYVGRIVPEKRLDLLLDAFREVETGMRLVVAGGDSYASDYLRRVQSLGSRDHRVLFVGYVYGDRLRALYSNAAAYVAPSEVEGLPLTVLEAASFGTPVVTSDIPPFEEILGESRPGQLMFRRGDAAALRAALVTTVDAWPDAEANAALLRERVLRSYDWDRMTEQVEEVYYRAVAASGR